MSFEGKVALVTGGNSGIGRSIVHRFSSDGARVAIAGRDPEKGRRVVEEVRAAGGEARFFGVDLAHEGEVQLLLRQIEDWSGTLNIVVNNAGLGTLRGDIRRSDTPGTRWDKLRGANLDSAYFVSSYAMPLLAKAPGGAIVNISSTATLHGNWGLYGVAKAAVEALTRSLAVEGAKHGIRANCVSPGWIETQSASVEAVSGSKSGEWTVPPGVLNRMGLPAEIAAAVAFLASEQASFITGTTLVVDGGLSILDFTSLKLLETQGWPLFSGALDQ